MKWLIPAAGLAILGWFVWYQVNTTKISYVNGLAPYDVMPGREYILEHDCYVFAWHKSIATAYPLLGVNHPDVRTSVAALPREVRPDLVGTAQPEVRLMNVIPQGTRIQILSVRSEQSRRTGTFISYEIRFLDGVDRPYQRVDIRPILLPAGRTGEVPQIDPTVAVPWIKR